MNKYKIFEGFTQSVFFADSISIPRFLLDHYRSLDITNEELVLVLHLLSGSGGIAVGALAEKMGLPADDIDRMLSQLQKKRILSVHETKVCVPTYDRSSCLPRYDFSGLMDQLFEVWGILRYRQMNGTAPEGLNGVMREKQSDAAGKSDKPMEVEMNQLKATFEQELGRPLTYMDIDHIRQWVLAGWSAELIMHALRLGVSAGIRTFRYLDSILREWEKKGIRSLDQALEDERFFHDKRAKRGAGSVRKNVSADEMAAMRAQYDDLYL